MPGTATARRNGVSGGWGNSTALKQRRSESVNVAPEGEPEERILVKSMSAGERRMFIQTGSTPAEDATKEEKDKVQDWYRSGRHDKVLLALCLYEGEYPMYPEARSQCERYLYSEGSSGSLNELDALNDIDPSAEILLVAAAMRVSLITIKAVEDLLTPKGNDPLAQKNETSTDLPKPSVTPIQN